MIICLQTLLPLSKLISLEVWLGASQMTVKVLLNMWHWRRNSWFLCDWDILLASRWLIPAFNGHNIRVSLLLIYSLILLNLFECRYFCTMLFFFLVTSILHQPCLASKCRHITFAQNQENPKVYPFFKDAVGALDRTHFSCNVTAVEQQTAQDHKGTITQNCLAMCDFDLKFLYMFSGWDGSTADFTMFHDTHLTDLFVLQGKYYLTNAGFPTCDSLSLHYYLAEWGWATLQWVLHPTDLIFDLLPPCY